MKRDLKLCYLILKQIVDYYAPRVPINIIRNIEPYSSDEVLFNSRLLDNIYIKRYLTDCNATVEITWQGIDLYEELKSKFETEYKPLGRSAPDDILGLLNHNILKQIDEEECKKIMDCINKELDKKPFVVVSVTSGYNTIKSVDYVDRFSSKTEADALIKEREKERLQLYKDRKDYIEKYLISSDPGMCSLIKYRIGFADICDMSSVVSCLTDTTYYDDQFENYNPPKRSQIKSIDFVFEMKEKYK